MTGLTTAILLAISAAFPATAQQQQRHVATADLDLATADGVHMLDRRIAAAARGLCADRRAMPHDRYTAAACRRQAARDARPQRASALAGRAAPDARVAGIAD